MMNRRDIGTVGLILAVALGGCGDDSPGGDPTGAAATDAGGGLPTGGGPAAGSGGAGRGGQPPTGGFVGSGGTGGLAATGARPATGGGMTGGSPPTGGATTGGATTGGAVPSGGATTGGATTGGVPPAGGTSATGGLAPTGGLSAAGGVTELGGTAGAGGASPPIDCSGIVDAGYEVCASGDTWCDARFADGAGCTLVCAAAGLACARAAEDASGACAADDTLPAVDCDSGHASDFCHCEGTPSGAGGAPGTGGASAGGASAGGASTGGSSGLCPAGISRTITVSQDGSGDFATVQAAVDSIPSGSTTPTRIDIRAGTYTEKITIASRSHLCLVGEDAASTVLTYNDANATVGSTSGSASVHISADDFSAAQLTFQNGYGPGSQAVALRTTGQRQQFRDCRFVAYQDTLYTHEGTQYFRDCYVQGNTDYVFGHGVAILQDCEVRNVQGGSAVAAPNTTTETAFGIVFLGGHFTAASGISNVALARPWGADGAAAFLNVTLDGHISAAGFTDMSGNSPANARFREYQSSGSGANPGARPSYQMSDSEAAGYTIANIYGGGWTPSYSQ